MIVFFKSLILLLIVFNAPTYRRPHVLNMVDQEIKQEYYIEIDKACRRLYELELDIDPLDVSVSTFTDEERIANKAYQRAFWFKFTVDDKELAQYSGKEFALKFVAENGNVTAYENWMTYPKKMQKAFQDKLEEITSTQNLWKKRINPNCESRCDNCKKFLRELVLCTTCNYGRYCSARCRNRDTKHQPVCHFLVNYLDWKNKEF
jgi:hypothetical protein